MITQIQFDALATLCRLRKKSATFAAVQEVMVHGTTVAEAARKNGIHYNSVNATYKSVLLALRMVHQAVTGEKA